MQCRLQVAAELQQRWRITEANVRPDNNFVKLGLVFTVGSVPWRVEPGWSFAGTSGR